MTAEIGLRDYASWGFDHLPKKLGATDFDRVIERRGNFLVWEFKASGKYLPAGQYYTFTALASLPQFTVYVCVDKDAEKDEYLVGRLTPDGVQSWWTMTIEQIKELEVMWVEEQDHIHKAQKG